MEDAFVYLLRCADGSLYCGWTVDLDKRIAAHRAGKGSSYVAARRPVRYAAVWRAETQSHARSAEARIKRLRRAAKLALVAGEAAPPQLGALERLTTRFSPPPR
jgi:putative endonuclease